MTSHREDTIDTRSFITDQPGYPAASLYVSAEPGDPATDALGMYCHLFGLPPVQVDNDDTLILQPARSPEWRMTIKPVRTLTVHTPEADLVHSCHITDSPSWCQVALDAGEALLVVGPPLPWTAGETPFREVCTWWATRGYALAVVPVSGSL